MLKGLSPQALKWIFIFVAVWCFVAVLPLSIGYYTFLRIIVTIGSVLAIAMIYQQKNKLHTYILVIITIFFNPLIPIYLQKKAIWIPFDILTGFAFLYLAFLQKSTKPREQSESGRYSGATAKARVRDVIITNKDIN
ncbi:hypothetical protein AQ505_11550 [Pedobacter sp. PACM 27299]|uniref:DUF6804 family protein n=1 Tax=Pedobacter sp. PACM 27299 TaxID=1727164 RepID=UPI0007065A3D|nr:DUF6804 family protein [Pedobacter sp. PACM 27299]ALL06070.1 hypothetical protein AQ505_11550 [Pedobacter sp. PACM 27299]